MSTSSSAASAPGGAPEVRPFCYPEAQDSELPGFAQSGLAIGQRGQTAATAREAGAEERGRQEGQAEARAAFEAQLTRERQAVSAALAAFARDRESYFEKVEGEVVQLALSIARKILHREAQVDPLLLAGIVRVALDKVQAGTEVVVRVHPHHVAEWRQFFACHMESGEMPEVAEDPALEPGRCLVQTAVGTAELGLEVQMKEVERGLMDLLAQRPQTGV